LCLTAHPGQHKSCASLLAATGARAAAMLLPARCALRPTSAQIPPPRRCSPSPFAGVGVVSGVDEQGRLCAS